MSPEPALVDKDVTSPPVALISAAKASSSLDILNDKELTSPLVALISAAKASSSLDTLNDKELTSEFVAEISFTTAVDTASASVEIAEIIAADWSLSPSINP